MIIGKPISIMGGGGLFPEIIVTAPTGSTVRLDDVEGTEISGTWTFTTVLGTHTITAISGGVTKTETVVVDEVAIYEVEITFSTNIDWTDTFNSFDTSRWSTFGLPTTTVSNNTLYIYTTAISATSDSAGVKTVQTITGSEKLIEATFVLNAETGTYYENYQSIGLRKYNDVSNVVASVYRTSYSSPYYRMYTHTGGTTSLSPSGYSSYPQTRKIVVDAENNQYLFYFNGSLIKTVSETITLSDFVEQPYISLAGGMWFAQSQTLSSISLKVTF